MSEAVKAFFDDVASCYDNVLPFFSEFGKAVAGALVTAGFLMHLLDDPPAVIAGSGRC